MRKQSDSTSFVGRSLGPYQIQKRLGAGGMGEVYRARDTRLGRDVTIKILPSAFTKDADRLRREAIPVNENLGLARQIAEAPEADQEDQSSSPTVTR